MQKSVFLCVAYIVVMSVLYPLLRLYSLEFQLTTHNSLRFTTGAVACLLFVFAKSELRENFLSVFRCKKLGLKVFVLGVLNMCNMLCLVLGLKLTSSVAGSIFGIMAMPLAVLLAAIFFVDERSRVMRFKFVAGSLVAIVGSLIFVVYADNHAQAESAVDHDFLIGCLLLGGSITCQAFYNMVIKNVGKQLRTFVMTSMIFCIDGVLFTIIALCTGSLVEVADKPIWDTLGLMASGLVGVAAGLVVVAVIKFFGIVTLNVLQLTLPVATAVVGYFLLDEIVNYHQVVGAVVLILGCIYAILLKDKPKQQSA